MTDDLGRYIEEIDALQREIDELEDAARSLYEERKVKQDERTSAVMGALYEVQAALDEQETYPLFEAGEFGRNGSYRFTEVLTHNGIMTEDVVRVNSAGDVMEDANISLYNWDDEPVTVEDYLSHPQRSRSEHIDKLAQRLQKPDKDLPTVQYRGRPS